MARHMHPRAHHQLLGFFSLLPVVLVCVWWGEGDAQVPSGAPNTWTTVARLPQGRMNPVAASADGRLFVFGGAGCTPRGDPCTTVAAYDPMMNTWTTTGTMPGNLQGAYAATTGPDGMIYISGQRSIMAKYDPRTNRWSNLAAPPQVDSSTLLVTGRDGRMYAVGGGAPLLPARAGPTQ